MCDDPKILEMLIEQRKDLEYIREILKDGKKTFSTHSAQISNLEKNQQMLMGKVGLIVMFIGAAITVAVNGIIWLWLKIIKVFS